MRSRHVVPVLPALLVALSACSATSSGHSSGSGAGGNGAGSGSGSAAGGGETSSPTKGGLIVAESSTIDNGSGPQSFYLVSATFYQIEPPDGGAGGASPGCQPVVQSGCTLSLCAGAGSGTPGPPPSAGTITVSSSLDSVMLAPTGSTYPSATGQTVFWNPGDSVTATAAGGDVPAFMLATPATAAVAITAPSFSTETPFDVDTTQDLVFAWSGTSPGQVQVSLTDSTGDGILTCQFDPSAGQGTVPKSLLSQLPVSATGAMSVQVTNRATATVGGFAMVLDVLTYATVNGATAAASITLH